MSAAAEDRTGAVVEQLRERIRQLQAAPRGSLATLRTGVEEVDALLPSGGFPLGQALELCGEMASGRTSLALRAVAAAHQERRLCAWVDGPKELYPPAAAAMGVDLTRLLIVRPKVPAQLAWTAVQLARSGAFACVVLDLSQGLAAGGTGKAPGVRLSLAEGKKLADAAFRGGSLLLLLSSPSAPADGVTRLRTESEGAERLSVEVVRSRQGGLGTRAVLPWQALYPALGTEEAAALRLAEELPTGEEDRMPEFYRGRSWERRNGVCGIQGQRPGRDAAMPSFRSRLGGNPPSS
ncbi:ImuA family protein [Stigmatella erecta]|uniref:Protein RecA n=1 Tax=Stigmatella erecta TaxID=83460 RepID=A0A1H9ZJV0_9BACT|nr:recombinase RecA [Stigmatella erecta]SES81877.1 recA DNA recombination protein [Stigmatella erecta]